MSQKKISKWAKAVQSFWFTKCGEDASKIKNKMGELPRFQIKPVVKAKTGDIRNMVLPGGGDLTTRIWSSMRVKVSSLEKWQNKGAYNTSACKDAIAQLEQFTMDESDLLKQVWKDIPPRDALRGKVETGFLIDAIESERKYDTTDLKNIFGKF